MGPTLLRRYRAERMLRRDFDALREDVLANVRANLGARRIVFDTCDLEAFYSQAWQGLYTVLMEGEEIASPPAWLKTVCYRRAIDEYRRRRIERRRLDDAAEHRDHIDPDLAEDLDNALTLRHTFEALRQRLDEREQRAASLCYLQGLTRAQAAEHMGISEGGMDKLMEGRGPGRPGVRAKVDSLLKTIQGGEWCEQQASLMRAYAFGVHDPDGERHRLAQLHFRECSACRAYVISLRGLAAVLPPLALPWAPGMAGGLGGALGGGTGAGAGAGVGAGSGAGVAGVGGAAGGGAAGGWLPLGGSLGIKLATGCLLLAGVGGGCVALVTGPGHAKRAAHSHHLARGPGALATGVPPAPAIPPAAPAVRPIQRRSSTRVVSSVRPPRATPASVPAVDAAQRELGFERAPRAQAGTASPRASSSTASSSPASSSPAGARGAESEFGPG